MQKINLPGMNLTDYSLRESISITDRFLGSGSLNTVLFISAKILVGTGTFTEWKTWIGDADLIIWSDPEIVRQAGIRAKDRIHEVENQEYIKAVLKRLGKGKKALYLLAESEEELEKLGYTVFEIRDDGGEWCSPCTLEEKVLVDFWGYAAVGNEDGARFLSEWIMKEEFFALEDCALSGWEPSEHCEIPIPQIAVITT